MREYCNILIFNILKREEEAQRIRNALGHGANEEFCCALLLMYLDLNKVYISVITII